ncbi:hypothetical protein KFE25_002791 [Diacronema lutheri]|uniref:Uncharacterized protein n=3 Tax=Diacronema lutheri TaxID=2081491 RepID=A0A8J5XRY4_DIALT|nr:hypothetical protein KFE25_002791 [Diacronema lutheri]
MGLAIWQLDVIYRCAFAAVIALIALIGLSLPARLQGSEFLPVASAFGGGVILSAALVHMLPDASACEALSSFPWGPTMLASGYLFLLSVEVIVDRIAESSAMHSLACCRTPLIPCSAHAPPTHAGKRQHSQAATARAALLCEEDDSECAAPSGAPSRCPVERARASDTVSDAAAFLAREADTACASRSGLGSRRSSRRPLAAVVATCGLSVHAVLEGLALGLRASPGDFAVICATIGVHKAFASLALGAVLADGPTARVRRVATLAFCSATPVGIVVGSALLVSTTCVVIAPVGAFSAGSLMWVALHEVISPATSRSDVAPVLLATWLGFIAMTLLAVWV